MMKLPITALCLLGSLLCIGQDSIVIKKAKISFRTNLNATLDKNLVNRLLIISNNSLIIENQTNKFEPVLNYRYGTIKPNGLPKSNLENDFFIQLENQFFKDGKVFPAAIVGFENSPNFRQLNKRFVSGGGIGTFLFKKENNFLQLNLYGIYERSDFNDMDYKVFRVFPSIKGILFFSKQKIGFAFSASAGQTLIDENLFRARVFIKPYIRINKQFEINMLYDMWYENKVNGDGPNEISTFVFGLTFLGN